MLFTDELLSVLPTESRDKIRRLDTARDVAQKAVRSAEEAYQQARTAKARNPTPGNLSALAHAEAARDEAAAAFRSFSYLSTAARHLDQSGAFRRYHATGAVLAHVKATIPKAVSNYGAAVADVRKQLDALEDERRGVQHAPTKAADLRAGLIDAVDKIAAEGAPPIVSTMRGGKDPAGLPELLALRLHMIGTGEAGAPAGSLPPFLIWLLRDIIVERIGTLIDRIPQDGALSDAERDARYADIAARRLDAERREEALIVAAESAGISIARRKDVHPCAILEIEFA